MNFNSQEFKEYLLFWFEIKYYRPLKNGEDNDIYGGGVPRNWLGFVIKDFNENFSLKPEQFEQPYTEKDMYDDIACYVIIVEGLGWRVYNAIAANINSQGYYSKHVKGVAKEMRPKINYME